MIQLPDSHLQEQRIAEIMAKQARDGWQFDAERGLELHGELSNRMQEIRGQVRPYLKHEQIRKYTPVVNPFTREGKYLKRVEDYWGDEHQLVVGGYSPVHWEEPDIDSRNKLMEQLKHHGWRPVNFTEKGNPQLDEASFQGLELGEVGGLLMEYFKARQRASTLLNDRSGGWLRACYGDGDGGYLISADCNPCGTPTHRMQHRGVVNVPKAAPDVYYGREFRELFTHRPGRALLGADASQIELRCLASYMGDEALIEEVCEGDFHTLIWDAISDYVSTRNQTKNVEYGLIYGASDTKLGSMADRNPKRWGNARLGKEIRRLIMQKVPAMDNLIQVVQAAASRGYLKGIDGFPIYVRSPHSSLNALLQHAGSMVVKRATCMWHEEAKDLDFIQVGLFHDEVQADVCTSHAQDVGKLFVECLIKSGHTYGLKCPMDGEYKIGSSWAETH